MTEDAHSSPGAKRRAKMKKVNIQVSATNYLTMPRFSPTIGKLSWWMAGAARVLLVLGAIRKIETTRCRAWHARRF